MKRKHILIVLTVLAMVAVLGYFALRDDTSGEKTGAPVISETGTLRPDPSNATFIIEDESITLSDGRNETSVMPGSAFVEETTLLDKFAYGDINADDKEDTVLFLARYGAGSGTFIYLAAFVSGPVTYRGSEALFLGDRISPQSISVNNGLITVKYLDRKPGDAMAVEPTVSVSKQFIYKSGGLQEK